MMPKAPTWPSTGPMTVATGAKGRRTRTDRRGNRRPGRTGERPERTGTLLAAPPDWKGRWAGNPMASARNHAPRGTEQQRQRQRGQTAPHQRQAGGGEVATKARHDRRTRKKEGNEERDAGGLGQPIALVHPRRLLFVRMRSAFRAGAGGCVCRGVYACPLVYRAPRRVSLPRGEWCDTPVFLHVVYFVLWLQ